MMRSECSRLRKRRPIWTAFRVALFAAALSLAGYIPYKYLTQLHAIEGLYAFLFPLSSILVVAGLTLSLRPDVAFRLPLVGRALIAAIATGWIATGVLCIPSLTRMALQSPVGGAFAMFHMVTQHVFLSLSVAMLVLVPSTMMTQFGVLPKGDVGRRTTPAEATS
jgi:hypothetical protein